MRAPSGPRRHSGVSARLQLWQRPGGAARYGVCQLIILLLKVKAKTYTSPNLLRIRPRKPGLLVNTPLLLLGAVLGSSAATLVALAVVVEETLLLRHEVLYVMERLVELALAPEHGVVEAHDRDALGVGVALAAAHGVEDVFGDFGDLGAALLELGGC